jgi:putative oxidoreductase
VEYAAVSPNIDQWVPRLVALYTLLFRVADKALWPFVDLALRLWLAHTFFISGMMKMMSPLTDASAAAAIGMGGAALLAAGLLTRPAALLLGALAVIAPEYRSLDDHLHWVALFAWYAIMGPGPISMDSLLRRGLADSALPGATRAIAAEAWVTSRVGSRRQAWEAAPPG